MRIVHKVAGRALVVVLAFAAMAPTCCPSDKTVPGFASNVYADGATCLTNVQSLCPAANTNADAECGRYCSQGKEDGCKGTVSGRQAPHVSCTATAVGLPAHPGLQLPKPGTPAPQPAPGPNGTCSVLVTCHCSD